ncbi:MAG: PAS domain-containing protein, partial [Candidatus Methylomirabilaceae bacterium]
VREASRAVRATDGKTLALIVCANITEQKRAEELLRQAHDELELRVEERTALLSSTVAALELQMAERKRAEEALRQSEERYRAIVEDQTEMICRWLPGATLTFVNQAYARYFGKSPDELIGQSFFSSIPEEERQAAMEHIKSLGENLSTGSCERRAFTAQDELRWLHWVDQPILDDDGGVVEFQSVGRDITERKRAEEGLQRSEERFRRVLETAPDGMVLVWPDGTIALANEQMEKLFGYSSEELIGQGVEMLALEGFRTEQAQQHWEEFGDSRDRPWGAGLELNGRRKDGSDVPVEIRLSPLEAPEGVLVCAAIRDITDRKQAEEALRQSEERYRTLVEYSPAAIVVHDLESGRYVDCNQSAIDLFGLDRDQLLEVGPEAVSPRLQPDGMPSEEKLRAATTRGLEGDRLEYEYTFVNAAGQEIPCEVRVVRLPVKDRILLRTSVINIADRKRAEEALEKHRAFLRQVIDIDPNFIFAKDREGRFTLVNQAVADAYGTTVEDLIGKTDADFNPSVDEVELFRRMDLEVMDTLQERFIQEERITDSRGKVRWLQTVKRPIVGEDGAADQVLGSATDITRRKRAEEELQAREAALRDSQKDLQDLAGKLLTAQEEERRRLARELHDDLTQRLAVLAIEAGRLEQQLHGV